MTQDEAIEQIVRIAHDAKLCILAFTKQDVDEMLDENDQPFNLTDEQWSCVVRAWDKCCSSSIVEDSWILLSDLANEIKYGN